MKSNRKQGPHPDHRILVIDDSPIMRNMLYDILSDDGYAVDTAIDGCQGMDMALLNDYAVIISDVHMPHKNGLETVRGLLTVKPWSRISLTDSYPDKLAVAATAEGALCCLQKPFDVNELRRVVGSIIEKGKIVIGR